MKKTSTQKIVRYFSKAILFACLLLFVETADATTYYSKTTGSANLTTTWGINAADGSGTAPANFTTNGDIFILRSASTLGLSNNWTIGTGVTLQVDGAINVTGNNDDITISGTVIFTNTSSTQVSLTGGGNGNNFTLVAGATLITANINGIRGTNCSLPTSSTSGTISLNTGANYVFNGASQSTTGLPATVNNLTASTGGTKTAVAAIAVSGILTINSGVTLNMGTNALTGAALTTAGTGTLQTQNTSAIPIPTGRTWAGTVQYNATAGGQTVMSGTYNNLTVSNTSGIQTAGGNLTVNGTLTTTAGGTLNLGTNQLLGTLATVTNAGTIQTQNTSATPIPTGRTWTGTVQYNAAAGGQTVITGTYNNLTLSNTTGTQSAGNGVTVNGILTIATGANLTIGANTLTLNGTLTGAGTLTGSASSNLTIGGTGAFGTLNFSQATDLVTNAISNLIINRVAGSVTLGNTLNILSTATFTAGALDVNGTTLRISGTVARNTGTITNTNAAGILIFNGTANQNIPAGIFTASTSSNITIANSAGVTFNSNVSISGLFQINASSLFSPVAGVVISGAGTLAGVSSTNSVAQVTSSTGVSDLTLQYSLNLDLTNLMVEYAGSAVQGIAATTFGALKISNASNVVMAGNVITGNLILNSGNLQIGGTAFTINGAVSRTTGNLRGSNTSNLVIGGAAGTLFFDGTGTGNYLRNLLLNTGSSASLGNALNITGGTAPGTEGTLRINGTGVLTTGGFLTIKSNANGTGRIAIGNSAGGYIIGDVTVERFIPQNANKAWRLLASNTTGQTINAAWQEGQIGPLSNTNPGYGTMIGGAYSTIAQAQAAGFDTLSQAPSVYRYDAATDSLVAVPNTNATLLSSWQGYFIYIRGDRSPYQFGASTVATTSTTLRSKGSVIQGDLNVVSVGDGQLALLRNPYASAIDLRNVVVGGSLVDAFQVWDPKLDGSFGLGGYQTLTRDGSDYEVTPGGGSYDSSGSIVNTIESGAAFFVQATGGTGTIQILESSKTAGSNLRFRPAGVLAESSRLITNLYAVTANGEKLADGSLIFLDAANNNDIDKKDVKKGTNFGENFGIVKNGTDLVVERRSLSSAGDTIFFKMRGLRRIEYKIEIKPIAINNPLLSAFLEDTYKATLTPLSLAGISTYTFTVDANAASAASGRFKIVFRPQGTLPVTFTDIKASQSGKNIAVQWAVANQVNISGYEVEKSINGRSFDKVATRPASQVNGSAANYDWLDGNAVAGVNYYRIKAIELSGKVIYTEIVKVTLGKNGTGITVSPNPVQGNLVNIQLNNQQAGRYSIRLVNNGGQELYKNVIQHTGGSASQSVNLPSSLIRGIYQLQIIAPDQTKQIQKLIIDRNN
jgi:hypothetical protein